MNSQERIFFVLRQGVKIFEFLNFCSPFLRALYSGDMTEEDTHAVLSNLAYVENQEERQNLATEFGWTVDPELSDINATLFYNHQLEKAILAFRGTNIKNRDDLAIDSDIAFGKRDHTRFNEAVQRTEKAAGKYKDLNLTGHSLGGTLALHAYEKLGTPTRVYNPGASIKGDTLKLHSRGNPEIIRHKDDQVSSGLSKYATKTHTSVPWELQDLVVDLFGNKIAQKAHHQYRVHSLDQFISKDSQKKLKQKKGHR